MLLSSCAAEMNAGSVNDLQDKRVLGRPRVARDRSATRSYATIRGAEIALLSLAQTVERFPPSWRQTET